MNKPSLKIYKPKLKYELYVNSYLPVIFFYKFCITITTFFFYNLFIVNIKMKVIIFEILRYLLNQNKKNVHLDNVIVIKPIILWSFSIIKLSVLTTSASFILYIFTD